MTKQVIQLGSAVNDGTGDPIRTAFTKVNANFTELYTNLDLKLNSTDLPAIPSDVSDLTDNNNLLGGAANTGLFTFNNNAVTISNDDMDLITERTSWDTDADIGIDAADDVWIDARGDQLALSAANNITFNTRTSSMYNQDFFGGEDGDFAGVWNGTTVTITVPNGTLINTLLDYYVYSTDQFWIETSSGFLETYTTANATVNASEATTEYILEVGDTSPEADLTILSMKLHDSVTTGNTFWEFRRDGVTQIPGPIEFDVNYIELHNGGSQQAQVLQLGNASYQAVITGPTPADGNNAQRLIIQGQRATGQYAEGGDVYLWGGDSDTNGGDIKIYAGDADSAETGQGGYVNIDGGQGFSQGGTVSITGGYSSGGTGGNVQIAAGSGANTHGNILLQTYGSTWTFDASGNLTIPTGGDIKDGNGTSLLGGGSTGNTVFYGNGIGNSDGTNTNDMVIAPNWDGEFTGNVYLTLPSNDNASNAVELVNNNTGGVKIITQNNATWQFAADGTLTLPTLGDVKDSNGKSVILANNRFVGVPTASTGAEGDLTGDIAINGDYLYYCTGDFGGTSYITNTVWGSISSTYAVAQGDIPMPTTGWTITIGGFTYNVTGDATSQVVYGNNAWMVPTANETNYSNGTPVVLTPPNNTHIWKRVAFSVDTW